MILENIINTIKGRKYLVQTINVDKNAYGIKILIKDSKTETELVNTVRNNEELVNLQNFINKHHESFPDWCRFKILNNLNKLLKEAF